MSGHHIVSELESGKPFVDNAFCKYGDEKISKVNCKNDEHKLLSKETCEFSDPNF